MGQTTIDGVLRENEVVQFGGTFQVNANGFTVADQTDSTKKAQFDCSGITTGTTRTITLPNSSGTLPTTASPTFTGSLTVTSTTGGVRVPNMTTTQRDAIATPAAGTIIYNTSTGKLNVYTTAWEAITSA